MPAVKVPSRYRRHWARPWTPQAKRSPGFRLWLSRQGLLTPHFSYADAACKDGTPIPKWMRHRARNHAFNLERFRHAMGDRPLPVLSWYRHPAYNRRIGGASQSRHMKGDATDFSRQTVNGLGRNRWFAIADVIFANGGVGDYPVGSAHLDSRGYRSRWRSF